MQILRLLICPVAATFLILSACKKQYETQEEIVVKFDFTTKEIPTIKFKKIVQLESTEASLFDEIYKLSIFKDHIYLLEKSKNQVKTLYLFKNNGSFKTKLKQGKGPGEVNYPRDFRIDRENNQILVSQGKLIHHYDLELNYITTRTFKTSVGTFAIIDQDHYLIKNSSTKGEQYHSYHLFNHNLDSITKKILPYPDGMAIFSTSFPFSETDGPELIFSRLADPNLYGFRNKNVFIRYKLDFGEYQVDNLETYFRFPSKPIHLLPTDEISSINNPVLTSGYLAFDYSLDGKSRYVIYSRNTGTPYYSHLLAESNILPPRKFRGIFENEIVIECSPDEVNNFLENNTELSLWEPKFEPEKNPVLVFFEIIN